jgi:hypothetical protein
MSHFPRLVLRLHAWIILPVLTMYVLTMVNNADPDLWGRLAVGAELIQFHRFPYLETFSFTMQGQPWFDHEWGSGVLFYWVLQTFGSVGLFWLKAGLALCTVWVCFGIHSLRRLKEPVSTAYAAGFLLNMYLLLPLIVPGYSTTIRCQQVAFLFYALFLWILEWYRRNNNMLSAESGFGHWKPLLGLPVLMLLWANVHGSFLLGLLLIAVYAVGLLFRSDKRAAVPLLVALLACIAMTLINPYGAAYYGYLIKAWFMPRADVTEWKNVFQAASLLYSVSYTLLFLVYAGLSVWRWLKEAPRSFPVAPLLLIALGVEGWLHIKLSAFFVLTALALGDRMTQAPGFIRAWSAPVRQKVRDITLVLCPVALVLAILVLNLPVWLGPKSPVTISVYEQAPKRRGLVVYPIGAMRYLQRTNRQGNLWCPFDWGEFLIWNLHPAVRVSMDGRYEEVYSDRLLSEHIRFYKQFDWQVPTRYGATLLLLPTDLRRKAAPSLRQHPEWVLLYEDKTASLYARNAKPQPPVQGQVSAKPLPLDAFAGNTIGFL